MNRDVDFLYELGALRLIDRQWRRFHSQNFANLADHHFRVAWIALVIAAREGGKIDTGKIVKMALVMSTTCLASTSRRTRRALPAT
jgi:5'-deoxynucleotidase YfbR-like HD superfamily hydrolase